MPRRPIQHVIDEMAQNVFKATIPPQWVHNTFATDYKKDYCVEVFENEEPTGELFIVQLKGKARLRARRDGKYVFPLDADSQNYYSLRLPLPVFLVLVDTATSKAFYTFVQGGLGLKHGMSPVLRSRSIEIDSENKLSDTPRLLRAVREAWSYMRDRFPGSVAAATELRRRQLETLDPRFRFDLSYQSGKTNVTMNAARKPVEIKVHVHGEGQAAKQAWRRFLDFGEPLEASKSLKISVTGSPVFEEHQGGIVKLERRPNLPVQVHITAVAGERRAALPVTDSQMLLARRRGQIAITRQGCPLSVDLMFEQKDDSPSSAMKFSARWK